MSLIEHAQQWRQGPPLAHRHPSREWMRRGMAALFDPALAFEHVQRVYASARSSTVAVSNGGLAGAFSGTANQQYPHRAAYAQTGALTILAVVDVDALSNYNALVAKQGTTTTNIPYELRLGAGATDSRINLVRADTTFFQLNPSASSTISAGSRLVRLAVSMSTGKSPNVTAWVNGSKYSVSGTDTVNPPTDTGSSSVWVCRRYDGATQFNGRAYYISLVGGEMSEAEHWAWFNDPFGVFEAPTIWVPVSVGGGPAILTEASSASDAATATYLGAASIAESASAAEVISAASTVAAAIAEAASAADVSSTGATYAAAMSEAAAASHTQTGAATVVRSLSEAASASDLVSTGAQYLAAVAEAAASSDAIAAAATVLAALTELSSPADQAAAATRWVRLLTEPAVAVDSVASGAAAVYSVTLDELLSAVDTVAAVMVGAQHLSAPPLVQRLESAVRSARQAGVRAARLQGPFR